MPARATRRTFLRDATVGIGGALLATGIGGCGSGAIASDVAVPAGATRAMRVAVEKAREARFPFGAALLDPMTGNVSFAEHNTTGTGDPTAHAEVNVLRNAGLAGIEFDRHWLITTAESCPMCAAAEVWAGVRGVVFGTSIQSLIDFGWAQIDLSQRDVMAHSLFNDIPVIGRFLEAETDSLYSAGPPHEDL